MDYCIGRITLHLSDNRIKSNQSIGIFYRYAEEAVNTFYTSYHQNIKRLEDLINHAPECFHSYHAHSSRNSSNAFKARNL